jgi:uncharacterized protein
MIRDNLTGGRALLVTGVAAMAVALAGCGGSSSSTTQTQTTASHVAANVRSTVPAPQALASASKKPQGESVLTSIHAQRPSASHPAPHLAGFDESSINTFVHEVDGDVGAFWQAGLNHAGYTYTPAKEDLITQTAPGIHSACSSSFVWTTTTFNAAYCAADNTFYLPTGFLSYIGHNFGDAAVAMTVAHENGHHIQALLGILQRAFAGQYHSIQIELQADCLAGVWMASEYQRGNIQPGDLQHTLNVYDDVYGDPHGFSPLAPGAHGSAAQRWASFSQGYNSGQGGECRIPALPTHE